MGIRYYGGNDAGPGPSYFRVWVQVETLSYDATGANVRYRYGLDVTAGNFNGTTTNGNFGSIVLYGVGNYVTTAWYNQHINFGSSFEMDVYQSYGSHTSSVDHYESVPALPNAPTIGANTRNSDYQNTIAWTASSTGGSAEAFIIERSLNGGAWNEIARVSGSATSYVDTTTAPDCFYKYRIGAFAFNISKFSGESSTTYNTPAAPISITGARVSGQTIGFTIENASATATGLDLQYSANGTSGWTAAQSYTGSPVTTANYSIGGTYYYRARNTRGSLASDWAVTENAIVSLSRANAPTITAPASGSVLKRGNSILFSWAHNPSDGTAQTKAEYGFSVNGGSWTSTTLNNATKSVTYTASTVGTLAFRVRTAGANGEWSDYTQATYTCAAAPTVSIKTFPTTVANVPINYELTYVDSGYAFAGGSISIEDAGSVVYTEQLSGLAGSITADEFIPVNGKSYTVRVYVRSSSSLDASTSAAFTVSFVLPQAAILDCRPDAETGYCEVTLSKFENVPGGTTATKASIYRVVGDEVVLLANELTVGATIVDRYAPLNTDYVYRAVSFASSGATNAVDYETRITTNRFFAYWKNNIAFGLYSPTMSISHARPQRQLIYYDGRKYPVLYDGLNHDEQYSLSFLLMKSDAGFLPWHNLMKSDGVCVFKAATGEVFHACVSTNAAYAFEPNDKSGSMTLNVVRIDGGQL